MTKQVILIVNKSNSWRSQDIIDFIPALQKQVSNDFAPVWGVDADICFDVDPNAPLMKTASLVTVMDNTDQAGALGYHDVGADGRAQGYVFAATDLLYNEDPRGTMSHEVLELLADPLIKNIAVATFLGKMVFTLREVCDAVESDACSYKIDGQMVSDFVYPAFFETGKTHPEGTKFDHTGSIVAPMMIAPGGYMMIKDPMRGGWTQVMGENVPNHKYLPPRRSRRERFLLRENHGRDWLHSTAV